MERKCSVESCAKPHLARGYCSAHWERWRRYGDPLGGRTPCGLPMAFIRKAVEYSEHCCLEWPYGLNSDGYGQISHEGRPLRSHILVCILAHGPRPEGLQAAHSCGNRACVNQSHLRWATRQENEADKKLHGTYLHGQNHHNAKLSDEDVAIIRDLCGHRKQREIARRFGVSPSTINDIRRGRTWSTARNKSDTREAAR